MKKDREFIMITLKQLDEQSIYYWTGDQPVGCESQHPFLLISLLPKGLLFVLRAR